jgi:hypothetical protein
LLAFGAQSIPAGRRTCPVIIPAAIGFSDWQWGKEFYFTTDGNGMGFLLIRDLKAAGD